MEADEAVEKIKAVLEVCSSWKLAVIEGKAGSQSYEHPWTFENATVFVRLDQFESRVQSIADLFETIVEFNRLEKVEIGGTKVWQNVGQLYIYCHANVIIRHFPETQGKILSSQVVTVYTEFTT